MSPAEYADRRSGLRDALAGLKEVRDRIRAEDRVLWEKLDPAARDRLGRLDRELNRLGRDDLAVAFVGGFSAGKSSLVNALLGRPLLPEDTKVTTAVPTFLSAPGPGDTSGGEAGGGIELHWLSEAEADTLGEALRRDLAKEIGRPELGGPQVPIGDLLKAADGAAEDGRGKSLRGYLELYRTQRRARDLGTRGKVERRPLSDLAGVVADEATAMFLDRVHVTAGDLGLPADVTLVDLPGISAPNPRHRDLTFRFVREDAHAVVLVLNATQVWTADVLEVARQFRAGDARAADRVLFALNRWDALNETQRAATLTEFSQKLDELNLTGAPPPFKTNALDGLLAAAGESAVAGSPHGADFRRRLSERYGGDRDAALADSGIPALREHLDRQLAGPLRSAVLDTARTVAEKDVCGPLVGPIRATLEETAQLLGVQLSGEQKAAARQTAERKLAERTASLTNLVKEAQERIAREKATVFESEEARALREQLVEAIDGGRETDAFAMYQEIITGGYLRALPYYFEIEIRVVDGLNALCKKRFLEIVVEQVRGPVRDLLTGLRREVDASRRA